MLSILRVAKFISNPISKSFLKDLPKCISTGQVISQDSDLLKLKIDEKVESFPLIWLRDNCRCDQCYHIYSKSRIINWSDFDTKVEVESIKHLDGDRLQIDWRDKHKSIFKYEWLKKRSFQPNHQKKYLENFYKPKKVFWDKDDFGKILNKYDYNQVLKEDEKLYRVLKDLAVYGVVMMKNAPLDKNEFNNLAKRIAFLRKTHYGEDYHITARHNTNNVAYSASLLQLHTDLPYYEYKPGTTFLHCIVQTEGNGGESLLTDIYYVAERLRKENKEVFDILTTTNVNWSDIGEENGFPYHKILLSPMITLDSNGNFDKVRHSIPQRDSYFSVPIENVKPWYKALKTFVELTNKHAVQFKTEPGDVLAFDNCRLVHGRMQYEDTEKIVRLLVSFNVDWDEIYSTMRVLQERINIK